MALIKRNIIENIDEKNVNELKKVNEIKKIKNMNIYLYLRNIQ